MKYCSSVCSGKEWVEEGFNDATDGNEPQFFERKECYIDYNPLKETCNSIEVVNKGKCSLPCATGETFAGTANEFTCTCEAPFAVTQWNECRRKNPECEELQGCM